MFFIKNYLSKYDVVGDASLPLSMEALGHAVGSMNLRRESSRVWCEGGFNAHGSALEFLTMWFLSKTLSLNTLVGVDFCSSSDSEAGIGKGERD
ncbi:hypothetical protein D3C78_1314770 [compost metagenome]